MALEISSFRWKSDDPGTLWSFTADVPGSYIVSISIRRVQEPGQEPTNIIDAQYPVADEETASAVFSWLKGTFEERVKNV